MASFSFNSQNINGQGQGMSKRTKVLVAVAAFVLLYTPFAIWRYNDRINNTPPKKIETTEDLDRASRVLEKRRVEVEKEAAEFGTPVE